jgi:uncharacterized membrane protein YbhN (UPF0104 family)
MGLRMAVSAILIGWLLWANRGSWDQLASVSPGRLWPAALVFAASTLLGAWQWALILRRAGLAVGHGRMQAIYWVGLFFNNFLPGNVGGDLVKVSDVAVNTGQVARTVAGTLLDRMLGLCALVFVAFAAAAVLGDQTPAGLPWWALISLVLAVWVASAVLLSGRLGRLLLATVTRLRRGRVSGRLQSLLGELRTWRADTSFVFRLAVLAFVVQSLRVTTHVLVAHAMDLPLDATRVLQLFVLVPVLGVAVVLPISFNGLGVREFVATRLMPQIGIGAESALTMQIVTYLVQVGVSLVGGAIFAAMLLQGRLRLRPKGDRHGN